MRVRILASMVLIILVTGTRAGLSAARAAAPLPFTLTDTGQILIPVMVNASGPYLFVLDTGANRSVISDTLAAALSLPPVAVTEIVTSTGSAPNGSMTSVVRLQSISLGAHSADDVLAPVLKSERIHAVHTRADGIIGQDVLLNAHYTLDYRRKRVIWLGAGSETGLGTRLTLRQCEGRLLVELPQSSRPGNLALLVPDSGASTLVLFQQDGRTAISATVLPAVVQTTTVTGDVNVQMAIVPKLRIGTETLWDQPAVLVRDEAASGERSLDGLLPLSLFSEVTFNGRENYLVVRR